jgi:hypothetical protein
MFPLDGSDVDESCLKGGGNVVDEECACHFVCNGCTVERSDGQLPSIRVDLMVVASDKPTQLNKIVYQRLYFGKWETGPDGKKTKNMLPAEAKQKGRALTFFGRLRLIDPKEAIGNPNFQIPLHLAAGLQCCGWIKKEQRKDKEGKPVEGQFDYRLPYGDIWPVDDPHVERIPKNPEYLAMAAAAGGFGGGGEGGVAAGAAADGDIDF